MAKRTAAEILAELVKALDDIEDVDASDDPEDGFYLAGNVPRELWNEALEVVTPAKEEKVVKTYMVNLLVPVSMSVEAETEASAIEQVLAEKHYSMTSPDGERVEYREEDVQSVEEA